MRSQDVATLTSEMPDLLMAVGTLQQVVGVVANNGGDNPRKASTIFYEVWWNTDAGILKVPGIQPCDQRPPDTINGKDVETTPLSVRSVVFGAMLNVHGPFVYWSAHERVAFAECGSAAGSGFLPRKLTGPGGEILADDDGGGGTGIPGQPPNTPPPAGEGDVGQ